MEPAPEFGVLGQIVPENFDGHQAVEAVAAGLIDHCHAAGADDLQYFVPVVQHFPYVLIHDTGIPLGHI